MECGDGWWVVGAVFLDRPTETRDTRPAAWFSADRETWVSVPVDARTYWGRRAILNSVACSRDRIAVVGARSGGAHGNPRVTSFWLDGETLVDVSAVFTQYGGVSATNVGPISGGPTGWLITGNRTSGPGVWFTDDPREFTRVEAEPGLTDDGDLESLTQGGGWAGDEWVVVGGGARTGRHLDPDPLAWTSPDGLTWTPQEMPATEAAEDAQRVLALDDGRLLVVGRSDQRFAAWLRDDDGLAASGDLRRDRRRLGLARRPVRRLARAYAGRRAGHGQHRRPLRALAVRRRPRLGPGRRTPRAGDGR